MTVPFKMFGLQRTCTNLVRFMLKTHFDSLSVEIGTEWKHGYIGKVADKFFNGNLAKIVVCVKNPYAWCYSCHAFYQKRRDPVSNYKKLTKKMTLKEFVYSPHYEWNNPILRWNEMNNHWLKFLEDNPTRGCWARAEDIVYLEKQVVEIKRIAQQLGMTQKLSFDPMTQKITPRSNIGWKKFDDEFYQKKVYLSHYDRDTLEFIDNQIDKELMKKFGYEERYADLHQK